MHGTNCLGTRYHTLVPPLVIALDFGYLGIYCFYHGSPSAEGWVKGG